MVAYRTYYIFFFFCLHLLFNDCFTQDGHYWTQQYGTRSMLLSGSVIGGVNDLGSVYYNPARLSQIAKPAFLLSADVYEWNTLKVEDAFGNNKDASKSKFGGVPSLAAGTFKIPFLKKHHFAWAILLRQDLNLDISYKDEVYDDVIENFPGTEYFGAAVYLKSSGKEEWIAFNWSYPLNEKLSIGVSNYLSMIRQSKSNSINLQALSESNQTAMYRFDKSYSYNHYNMLFKIGLSYSVEKFTLGLTLNTASFKIFGDGNFQHELFFSGIEGSSIESDIYKSSYQENLETRYHSPWSAGLGLTFKLGKSKLHLSTEWFSAIPKYTVMQSAQYVGQSEGDTNNFRLVDEFNSIINGGIGLELYLSDNVSFYASFCTDFSAVVEGVSRFVEDKPEAYNSVFKSDFYHLGSGFVLDLKGADLTLGVTYTGAKIKMPRPFTFPEDEDDDIFDPDDLLEVKWNRWRIVLSFSFPFIKDVQKKAEEKMGF